MSVIDSLRRPGLSGRVPSGAGLAFLVVPLLLIGAVLGWAGHGWGAADGPPRAFDGFVQVRLKTIQTQLDQVRGPYIAVLGDSHAERLYLPSLCGLPVVNAGISGVTLGEVLDLLRKVSPPHPAEAVLISVGTNDIWVKRKPESAEAQNSFRAGLAALKQALTDWGGRRALIAIPPVADKEEALFPRPAAARYSAMLAESCEPERCVYLDLFGEAAGLREPRSPFSDGVHLRDYARFVRHREAELCRGLGLMPGR